MPRRKRKGEVSTGLDVLSVPVGTLHANPWNPNVVGDDLARAISESVDAFGFIDPVLVRPIRGGYEIIDGEHRWLAARKNGNTHVDVIVRELSDEDAKKLTIILNEHGTPDVLKLGNLLADLAGSLDLEQLRVGLRYDTDALERLVAIGTVGDRSEPDETMPEPPKGPPITQPDEVVNLGRHRLVCGDATDMATWSRLLAGDPQRPALVVTDPPYGVGWNKPSRAEGGKAYGAERHHGVMAGDGSGKEAAMLWEGWLDMAQTWCAADATAYTFGPLNDLDAVVRVGTAVLGSAWRPVVPILWDRGFMGLGRFQGWRHRLEVAWELQLGAGAPWLPPDAADNLLSGHQSGPYAAIRDPAAYEHPTPKPITLMQALIDTRMGDVVVDPFAGSGATLLAAERAGRTARVIEIDPTYCDLVRRRWAQLNG